jgi:hypothetical protein
MKFFSASKDVIKTVFKIISIKPLRELAVKLVVYYKNDKRYDSKEIIDLFFTAARLFGVKANHDSTEKRITINY